MNWIKKLGAALGLLLITSTVYAGANFSRVKTWTSREILTYSNLNAEFDNILTNFTPSGMDDYSSSVSQMRSTADPYPASAESLPTSLAGELERIRYVIAQISGETYWYQDPVVSLSAASAYSGGYKKPELIWISSTTVDLSTNTSTTNMRRIIFPDGDVREVTENTNTASQYCRFNIEENASFAALPENSGLQPTYVRAANTWYVLYAVKSTTDTTKFVVVGSTITPIPANYSALDSAYAASGWVPLGTIRYGDSDASSTGILSFRKSGRLVVFTNTVNGGNTAVTGPGINLATTAGATSLTYTYAAGTGDLQIPANISQGIWSGCLSAGGDLVYGILDGTAGTKLFQGDYASGRKGIIRVTYPMGINFSSTAGTSSAMDILLSGFYDDAGAD